MFISKSRNYGALTSCAEGYSKKKYQVNLLGCYSHIGFYLVYILVWYFYEKFKVIWRNCKKNITVPRIFFSFHYSIQIKKICDRGTYKKFIQLFSFYYSFLYISYWIMNRVIHFYSVPPWKSARVPLFFSFSTVAI